MLLLWLFLAIAVLLFAGSFLLNALRWFGRIALASALAIVSGLIASGFAPLSSSGSWLAVFVALAVFGIALALLGRRKPVEWRDGAVRAGSAPDQSASFRRKPPPTSDPWDQLKAAIPEHAARVNVARESFRRMLAFCKDRAFDMEALDTRRMLDDHVPKLICQEVRRAADLPEERAVRVIGELVDLIERVAADCERRLAASGDCRLPSEDPLRRHIENFFSERSSDPFA